VSTDTDFTKIIRAMKRRGYETIPGGAGHRKVVDKHGKVVKDSNGPLIISSSPSDHRARTMHVHRLMKAGVLTEDPFESNPEAKGARLADPDVQAKKLAALQKRAAEERNATIELREFLEPFIVMIGGWEKHGQMTLIGRVAMNYLDSVKQPGRWKTLDAAVASLRNLRSGNVLSDAARKNWKRFFDALADDNDPLTKWNEMHRETIGIGYPDTQADEPHTNGATPTAAEEAIEQFMRDRDAERPLALDALYYMARGAGDNDKDEVFALYERIADLEGR